MSPSRALSVVLLSTTLHLAAVGLALGWLPHGRLPAVLWIALAEEVEPPPEPPRPRAIRPVTAERAPSAQPGLPPLRVGVPDVRAASGPAAARTSREREEVPGPVASSRGAAEPGPSPRVAETVVAASRPETARPAEPLVTAPEPAPAAGPVAGGTESRPASGALLVPPATREAGAVPGGWARGDGASSSAAAGRTSGGEGGSSGSPGQAIVASRGPSGGEGEPQAEYGLYLQEFRKRVQEALHYPLSARRRGVQGRVELDVLIEATGRVSRVTVVSGADPVLDRAAVEAVRGLGPLPFPDHLPRRRLRVLLPLDFEFR